MSSTTRERYPQIFSKDDASNKQKKGQAEAVLGCPMSV
jgi:hypothetical protein